MMSAAPTTIHASAVLIGARAVLIRGPSGSGKSHLALALLNAGVTGLLPMARLIADDRAHIEAARGRLIVRPAPVLAGLLEVRGLGLRRLPHEPVALVGWVVDLDAADATRLPADAACETVIGGIRLPRLPVAAAYDPLPAVLGWLATPAA